MTSLLPAGAAPELLWSGGAWLEGPAWVAGLVRFSDIPNNRVLEFDPATHATRVQATGAGYANGRTVDNDGRVVQCSHGRRAIEREDGGVMSVVVDRWAAGRFNSPNDVVVASDGAIWFTDPPYGIHESGAEGYPGTAEYEGCFVFRADEDVAVPVITDMVHPNGLAFSPDESLLYVAETGNLWHPEVPLGIRVYNTTTFAGRPFVIPSGIADGFRVDPDGNIWTSAGAAIEVFSPEARLLAAVPFPERVSNLCFGGDGHVYVTASTGLYRLRLG